MRWECERRGGLFITYPLIDVFLVKASLNNSANNNGSPSLSRTELGSIVAVADHVILQSLQYPSKSIIILPPTYNCNAEKGKRFMVTRNRRVNCISQGIYNLQYELNDLTDFFQRKSCEWAFLKFIILRCCWMFSIPSSHSDALPLFQLQLNKNQSRQRMRLIKVRVKLQLVIETTVATIYDLIIWWESKWY